ncbi:SagB family peptide dehydrogenase [Nocardia iowensis]|uniref:SagB family peptide dehydrogenase n=1 Tax=Nocardia iowensis TaxID=204891 RepID=A0ABX8RY12_NOCIO|nr:SagB family peptide dehydrogenase [Nocardia iowensis]QXN92431.1 SagB family peptide dehydrogenase [Nocardia iowensis]
MPTLTFSDQTRLALRAGATCVTTPAGAILLNPPNNQKLPGLTKGQLLALKTLNQRSATLAELSQAAGEDDVTDLVERLATEGWLAVTVRDGGRDLYSVQPFGRPRPRPDNRPIWSATLSKFAVLHRDSDGFVLEHPLSWCDVRIHDPRLLALLDGPGAADSNLPIAVKTQFADDLFRCGFLVADTDADDHDFTTRSWSAPDLWFHRRSTLGERIVTWEHFGPTKWAKGQFPQPPARKAAYPGEPIALPTPDLSALRETDPTLTAVLEDRISTREFDDTAPITVAQLGELLYRTARIRSTRSEVAGEELVSKPYPSGGSVYELELYPVVRHVAGLAPGMYHYDSHEHVLRPVAAADSPAVAKLVKSTSATLSEGAQPQVLLVMGARTGRVMWTYEQVSYAVVLKHVGVLMQTIYLAATAMGLGACAQGFGDTEAFVTATGVDELEECSVGSIIIGSPAPR